MRISAAALNTILDHAGKAAPRECCGILMASGCDGSVDLALRAENAAENPLNHYVLGHEAHLRAVRLECGGAASIAGYYHSHPIGEAKPSPDDARKAVKDAVYFIAGLRGPDAGVAAWRFDGKQFGRVPLEVIERHEHTAKDENPERQRCAPTIQGHTRSDRQPRQPDPACQVEPGRT